MVNFFNNNFKSYWMQRKFRTIIDVAFSGFLWIALPWYVLMPWSHLCVKSPRKSHVLKRNYRNQNKLEVICHADKLRWYASTEWIENLSTFPTSDSKLKTTLSIAHSLSYNILNLGTKWSHNNRDTAQRSLPCRFMFVKKKSDLP